MFSKKTKLKIESGVLVFLSLVLSFFKGKADRKVNDPKTIALVNLTTNIGDMIMITPMIHAVKKAYPMARVVVVGGKKNREVLLGNTDMDAYVTFVHFWTTLLQLAEFKPDMGVAVNPSPHEIALLYLSGTHTISVFAHPTFQSASFKMLSKLVAPVPYEEGKYVPGQYLKLLEPHGVTSSDTSKHLHVHVDALEKVKTDLYKARIPIDSFLVLAPGAGQLFREWAPERFAELARHAHQTYGVGIVLAGGPGDKVLTEKITGMLSGVPVFDGTSQTIEELKAVVSLATAVISNDSGIAYIAEAFNVPSVIIVGISDADEHPNGSPKARVVMPLKQEFVIRSLVSNLDKVDVESARRHLDSIPVSKVVEALDLLSLSWKTKGTSDRIGKS